MILFACALLAVGSFLYVFTPAAELLAGRNKSRLEYLRERKQAIYDNLRDLNFEHKAGKLDAADFQASRESLEDEAAAVIAEIQTFEQKLERQPDQGRG